MSTRRGRRVRDQRIAQPNRSLLLSRKDCSICIRVAYIRAIFFAEGTASDVASSHGSLAASFARVRARCESFFVTRARET